MEQAQELISTFLSSLYERQDLDEHLNLYHPDAWVLLGETALRRSELTPSHYQALIASLLGRAAAAPASKKPAHFEIVSADAFETSGADGMLTMTLVDTARDHAFTAFFQVRRENEGWKWMGCTMGVPLKPTFETLAAMVACELAQAPWIPEPHELYLTPIDLAYHRAQPPEDYFLDCLPEARFSCHHSGHCCETRLNIRLPDVARRVLEAVDWKRLDPGIPETLFVIKEDKAEGRGFQMAGRDGDCAFRRKDGCLIHQTVGYMPLAVCMNFPVSFTATPEGVGVSPSFLCPSARANRGELLSDRLPDMSLRARQWRRAMHSVPDAIPLCPGGPVVSFSQYRALEDALLSLLASEAQPHRARVIQAVKTAWRLADKAPDDWSVEAIAELAAQDLGPDPDPATTDGEVSLLSLGFYMLLKSYQPATFAALSVSDAEKLDLPKRLSQSGIQFPGAEDTFTRFLRQVLFRRRHLTDLGILGHVHVLAWAESLVRLMATAIAMVAERPVIEPEDLAAAIEAFELGAYHSRLLELGLWRHENFAAPFLSRGGGMSPSPRVGITNR